MTHGLLSLNLNPSLSSQPNQVCSVGSDGPREPWTEVSVLLLPSWKKLWVWISSQFLPRTMLQLIIIVIVNHTIFFFFFQRFSLRALGGLFAELRWRKCSVRKVTPRRQNVLRADVSSVLVIDVEEQDSCSCAYLPWHRTLIWCNQHLFKNVIYDSYPMGFVGTVPFSLRQKTTRKPLTSGCQHSNLPWHQKPWDNFCLTETPKDDRGHQEALYP